MCYEYVVYKSLTKKMIRFTLKQKSYIMTMQQDKAVSEYGDQLSSTWFQGWLNAIVLTLTWHLSMQAINEEI